MLKRIVALLLAVGLLLGLSACKEEAGQMETDSLLETARISMEEGHFFFVGKVLSAVNDDKMITYYDAETNQNTFYQVEVTDDLFGCLPDGVLSVCIYGTSEHFSNRKPLEKGKEYFFDVRLWVDEGKPVYLLPTFYDGLPEKRGEKLFYTDPEGSYKLGKAADYRAELLKVANRSGYGAKTVVAGMTAQLELAVKNSNQDHFKELEISDTDPEFLARVTDTAKGLLTKTQSADKTWKGIEGVLQK